jgi:hypothetical protein
MNWQPIETAPRGERVLVALPRRSNPVTIAEADKDDGMWWEWGPYESDLEDLPTHWQPLPAPHESPTSEENLNA